jgi:peptidyl-prolyl cis-trans isomerase D
MQVSKKLVDGDIASNPFLRDRRQVQPEAVRGPAVQNRITPAAYREDLIANTRYGNWLVNRATLGSQVPDGVILPYASLLLERRTGIVGLVHDRDGSGRRSGRQGADRLL